MSLNIIRPGLLTTIQDTGRYGYQKIGVIPSGAMDVYSLRLANILVGNDENEGALEITLMGPTIEFTSDTLIAITGGDFGPVIDGQKVPMHRPVAVKAGAAPASSAAGLIWLLPADTTCPSSWAARALICGLSSADWKAGLCAAAIC